MAVHNLAFWLIAFFLLGVFFISFPIPFHWLALMSGLAVFVLLFQKQYQWSLVVLALLAGSVYYLFFDRLQQGAMLPVGENSFEGVIVSAEQRIASEQLVVSLSAPYSGKIKVITGAYPRFQYGDLVSIIGKIETLVEDSHYLMSRGVLGIVSFPEISLKDSGQGNPIIAVLFNFKNKIKDTFQRVLPADYADLLTGLTLGDRENFSEELTEAMRRSGTTHLVALSGYNITVIVLAVGWLFQNFLSRRVSFFLSVAIIILFVLMTGAPASVVRAAVMGIIVLIAGQAERQYSLRNAIIVAAFLMALFNPKVLVFDIGFQLSFAALLGIVYLLPILKSVFRIEDAGWLSWKTNLLTTISAQLAVIPLLLGYFGSFSLTSFLANVLVAEAVPLTMALGFLIGGLGFISGMAVNLLAWTVWIFLAYEVWIIRVFSDFALPVFSRSFGLPAAIVYYLILGGAAYGLNRWRQLKSPRWAI